MDTTPMPVRGRPIHSFYLAVLLTVVLLAIDITFNLLVSDEQGGIIFSDVVSPIIDLLASAALFIAARQSATHSKRLGIAWGIIALSTLSFALGDISWAILELGLEEPPFPSLADAFYIAF
jgi:two-component system, sensor histidine kinase PdtaS